MNSIKTIIICFFALVAVGNHATAHAESSDARLKSNTGDNTQSTQFPLANTTWYFENTKYAFYADGTLKVFVFNDPENISAGTYTHNANNTGIISLQVRVTYTNPDGSHGVSLQHMPISYRMEKGILYVEGVDGKMHMLTQTLNKPTSLVGISYYNENTKYIQFNDMKTFTYSANGKATSGTYVYDNDKGTITLRLNGEDLNGELLFDSTEKMFMLYLQWTYFTPRH